ncbi:hypothetical protein BJB45_11450 [Halomonas huangheensis]|uniref:Uncharacterized protein n=1 Tax=Halomonas huangheensis TaxID=1178482 RepID=W1N8B8_9GAMM|nr:hypothetical protein BJB45_11450 [Halomonas huangheensis]
MAVDEAGNHQAMLEVDDIRGKVFGPCGAYIDNVAVVDRDVDPAAVGSEGIDKEAFSHMGPRMMKGWTLRGCDSTIGDGDNCYPIKYMDAEHLYIESCRIGASDSPVVFAG